MLEPLFDSPPISSAPPTASRPIPAFINPGAGSAPAASAALARIGGFDVRQVDPPRLADAVRQAVNEGATRVVVAGGDGSIQTAATVLAGTPVALALLPAGTLNHLAKDLALPLELDQAATIAGAPEAAVARVDVGYANDRLFLNTASVGAYVTFVRLRERLERHLGYRVATIIAGLRMLIRLRTFRVTLEVDGVPREYVTPLIFIGVGERELKLPTLGARVEGGAHGLHVMVVRSRTGARTLALALAAAARGLRAVSRSPAMDCFLVDHCRVELHRRSHRSIAIDGEVVSLDVPIDIRLARGVLKVVVA